MPHVVGLGLFLIRVSILSSTKMTDLGGTFSPFQIQISVPERNKPLTNNNVSYGTIFIKGTTFSLFAQLLFFFTEIKEYNKIKKVSHSLRRSAIT